MKKRSLEDFIHTARKVHGDRYDYSRAVYQNSYTALIIVCPLHGEFLQTPTCHLRGQGCRVCGIQARGLSQRNSKDEFVRVSNQVHGEKYDYSLVGYVGNKTKVIIICPAHGEFSQTPNNHMRGHGCPRCAGEQNGNRCRKTIDRFIADAIAVHGEKYDYSRAVYETAMTKIVIVCRVHGQFSQTPADHLTGYGCPDCAGVRRLTTETFIARARVVHGKKYDYSLVAYVSAFTKVNIICPIHGLFSQGPHNHLRGVGCPRCTKRVSTISRRWLDSIGLPDDADHREVRLTLKDASLFEKKSNHVTVDGFDPATNTVYLFHGDYWHGNLDLYPKEMVNKVVGKTMLRLRQETHDVAILIRESGYNLVEMWESEFRANAILA